MAKGWRNDASVKLAALTGLPVNEYSHFDFGRAKNTDCISVLVEEVKGNVNPFKALVGLVDGVFGNPRARKQAVEFMSSLRKQLGPGAFAFIGTTRWLGEFKPNGVELVVAPGDTQMDIIRQAHTHAGNYDLDTEDLVKKLSSYHEQFGIDITQAETDTIWFDMLKLPADLHAFAEDLYEFCPDIVEQGCGSVDGLEEELKKHRRVCLWWD